MAEQRWIALESNPDVLNKYVHNLGAPAKWKFVDIYGLDDDLLAVVPQPVVAIMLLYPKNEKVDASPIGDVDIDAVPKMYFIKQSIRNACGTIALVHALANNIDKIEFDGEKHFSKFLEATKGMTPEDKATHLENDKEMGSIHEDSAQEGQTQAPSRDENVIPHFIAFVNHEGALYEMDGGKDGPVRHGDTTPEALLKDTVAVVKKFMARDPDQVNFTLMALVKED